MAKRLAARALRGCDRCARSTGYHRGADEVSRLDAAALAFPDHDQRDPVDTQSGVQGRLFDWRSDG